MWLLFTTALAAQLENPGFEQGAPGDPPPGWELSEGGAAALGLEDPAEGRQLARLERGALEQTVDVSALAGQRVQVSMRLRPDTDGVGGARFSLRGVDGALWADHVEVWEPGWREVRSLIDVPQVDRVELVLEARLLQGDALDVDAALLEPLGPASAEGPAPLASGAAERLVAWSRLYSYARWFHPADQALDADWDAIAVAGTRMAESISDPDALAREWEALLRPAAPTLQVWAEEPPAPNASTGGDRSVTWHHMGAGTRNAASDPSDVNQIHPLHSSYRRFRIDDGDGWRSGLERAITIASVDARPWREETVEILADGQVEGDLEASVVLRADGGVVSSETPTLGSGPVSLLLAVPQSAETLELDVRLKGDGALDLTALSITPRRSTTASRLLSAVGAVGLEVALVGALALTGALLSKRTIGGFIFAIVGLIALSQLGGLNPEVARALPMAHMENLSAQWSGDARALSGLEEEMGGPIRAGVSLLIFWGWILGLLAASALRLRAMDIRGGGD